MIYFQSRKALVIVMVYIMIHEELKIQMKTYKIHLFRYQHESTLQALTCTKSTIETSKQGVNPVQS